MARALDSLVTWTKVVYALHAFSLLTGILGTATPTEAERAGEAERVPGAERA